MEKQNVWLDQNGVYRVDDTRMMLDGIVELYRHGMSREGIRCEYPDLTLEQVHGAIGYFLANRDEIDQYLKKREETFERLRAEAETRPNPARERIRAMKRAVIQE